MSTNVPTRLTKQDLSIFEVNYPNLRNIKNRISPEEELEIIRKIHNDILVKVPPGMPIPDNQEREPTQVLQSQSGQCFDRARLYEKVFLWMGFASRRVYIKYVNEKSWLPVWLQIFTRSMDTHAVTEVNTSSGWLVVDSNSTWMSINSHGQYIGIYQLSSRINEFDDIPSNFKQPFISIVGLYSRHGRQYPPYWIYVDVNWYDLIEGFLSRDPSRASKSF